MKVEQRQHPRVDVWLNAEFQSAQEVAACYMTNISKGGMFMQVDKTLNLGAEVGLTFQLPGQEYVIRIKGKVVWTSPPGGRRKPGMGVQLAEMPGEDRQILDKFIQAELAKAKE